MNAARNTTTNPPALNPIFGIRLLTLDVPPWPCCPLHAIISSGVRWILASACRRAARVFSFWQGRPSLRALTAMHLGRPSMPIIDPCPGASPDIMPGVLLQSHSPSPIPPTLLLHRCCSGQTSHLPEHHPASTNPFSIPVLLAVSDLSQPTGIRFFDHSLPLCYHLNQSPEHL